MRLYQIVVRDGDLIYSVSKMIRATNDEKAVITASKLLKSIRGGSFEIWHHNSNRQVA